MEKTLNKIKKSIAVLTATSLLISFVVGPTAASAINNEQTKEYNQIFKEFILPYSYGKITKSHFAGTDRVIINIQDLHCHPKVQKNISNIIETFDKKYGVSNIYLEGAYGNVSTQWIVDKINKDKTILEKMMDTGRLTGAEYYSALSGKTEIIRGLEEKEPYLDNIARLGNILDNQEKIDLILKTLDESVNKVKKKYYSKRQYKIENLFEEYKQGKITSQKYYTLLSKHIDKLGIDLTKYENTLIYITLLSLQKELDYKKITAELQSLISVLKQQLPYNAYKSLLENTSNFQELEKFYSYVIQLDKSYDLNISSRFGELNKYFGYIELSKKINPVELLKEDDFLSQEINTRFSQTTAQRDVVFLVHFGRFLRDYVTTKITLEDYKYYKDNIEQYRKLYNKYVDNRVLSLLDEYIVQTDKFYEINMARNIYFTENMFDENESFAQIEQVQQAIDDINKIITNMDEVKNLDIVVTGGFHSQTVTELLEQQNVSYVVITPNVTDGIKLAEETYYELAKEQSKISFQTIAPVIASLSPQLQEVLLNKIENKDTQKIERIMSMNDEERAQTIAELATAKLLESDDLGNLEETLLEVVRSLVTEHSKEQVTPELLSKMKRLEQLLQNKEQLQKVIDSLQKGPIQQAVMLISEMYDNLYEQFFGTFTDKERSVASQRKDIDNSAVEKNQQSTSQQKWTMNNVSKETPYSEKYKLVYYILEKNCKDRDIVLPEEQEFNIINDIISAYDSSFREVIDFEDWVYDRLIVNIIDFQQKQERLKKELNECFPDDIKDILWIFSQCLAESDTSQVSLKNIIVVANALEKANNTAFSDEVYDVLNILKNYKSYEVEQIFVNIGLVKVPNAAHKQVLEDIVFKQIEDDISGNENEKAKEIKLNKREKANFLIKVNGEYFFIEVDEKGKINLISYNDNMVHSNLYGSSFDSYKDLYNETINNIDITIDITEDGWVLKYDHSGDFEIEYLYDTISGGQHGKEIDLAEDIKQYPDIIDYAKGVDQGKQTGFQIVTLGQNPQQLQKQIADIFSNKESGSNITIALYPSDISVDYSSLSDVELYNLFKQKFEEMMSFCDSYFAELNKLYPTVFYEKLGYETDYFIRESLKNAFVHGNKCNVNLPIVISVDLAKRNFESLSVINHYNENQTADKRLLSMSAAVGLSGVHSGVSTFDFNGYYNYYDSGHQENSLYVASLFNNKNVFAKRLKDYVRYLLDLENISADDEQINKLINGSRNYVFDIRDFAKTIVKQIKTENEKRSKISQLQLPSTRETLKNIGNIGIIKAIYKSKSGENFRFTILGVALGVLIETFKFWSPDFIEAHDFDSSVKAGMTAVVWVVRALSIGIGIWTGSILALFIAETITHFIWNIGVIVIGRQDLLLQTSKEKTNISVIVPSVEEKKQARELTQEEEKKLEETLTRTKVRIKNSTLEITEENNKDLAMELQAIFESLLDSMVDMGKISESDKKDYELILYLSDEVNAFTVSGSKTVFISTGMLHSFSTYLNGKIGKEHVAAILAHELEHTVQDKRVYRDLVSGKGDQKKDEYDSDIQAIFILDNAGYNPISVQDLMEFLAYLEEKTRYSSIGLNKILDAHPDAQNRLVKIKTFLSDRNIFLRSTSNSIVSLENGIPYYGEANLRSDIHRELGYYEKGVGPRDSNGFITKMLKKYGDKITLYKILDIFNGINRFVDVNEILNYINSVEYPFFNDKIKNFSDNQKKVIFRLMNSFDGHYPSNAEIYKLCPDMNELKEVFDFIIEPENYFFFFSKISFLNISYLVAALYNSGNLGEKDYDKIQKFLSMNEDSVAGFSTFYATIDKDTVDFYIDKFDLFDNSEKYKLYSEFRDAFSKEKDFSDEQKEKLRKFFLTPSQGGTGAYHMFRGSDFFGLLYPEMTLEDYIKSITEEQKQKILEDAEKNEIEKHNSFTRARNREVLGDAYDPAKESPGVTSMYEIYRKSGFAYKKFEKSGNKWEGEKKYQEWLSKNDDALFAEWLENKKAEWFFDEVSEQYRYLMFERFESELLSKLNTLEEKLDFLFPGGLMELGNRFSSLMDYETSIPKILNKDIENIKNTKELFALIDAVINYFDKENLMEKRDLSKTVYVILSNIDRSIVNNFTIEDIQKLFELSILKGMSDITNLLTVSLIIKRKKPKSILDFGKIFSMCDYKSKERHKETSDFVQNVMDEEQLAFLLKICYEKNLDLRDILPLHVYDKLLERFDENFSLEEKYRYSIYKDKVYPYNVHQKIKNEEELKDIPIEHLKRFLGVEIPIHKDYFMNHSIGRIGIEDSFALRILQNKVEQYQQNSGKSFYDVKTFNEFAEKVKEIEDVFYPWSNKSADNRNEIFSNEVDMVWANLLHNMCGFGLETKSFVFVNIHGEELLNVWCELTPNYDFVPNVQQTNELLSAFVLIKKYLPKEQSVAYARMLYEMISKNKTLSVFESVEKNLELLDFFFEGFSEIKDDYIYELLENYDIDINTYNECLSKTTYYAYKDETENTGKNFLYRELATVLSNGGMTVENKIKFIAWLISDKQEKPEFLKHITVKNDYEGDPNHNRTSLGEDAKVDIFRNYFWSMTKSERAEYIRELLTDILKDGTDGKGQDYERLKNTLADAFFDSMRNDDNEKIVDALKMSFKIILDSLASYENKSTSERQILFISDLIDSLVSMSKSNFSPEEKEARQIGRFIVAMGSASGVAVVKILQILSNSKAFNGLGEQGFIINEEISKVRSSNEQLSKRVVFQQLEALGMLEDVESVGKCLGSASIGVTYLINMKDGSKRIVKIKRPSVLKNYGQDLVIAERLIDFFKFSDILPQSNKNMIPTIKFLEQVFNTELNFEDEVDNLLRAKANLSQTAINTPDIVGNYNADSFMQTMASGKSFDNAKSMYSEQERSEIYSKILLEFFREVFMDGFFHADLHEGNIFVDENKDITFIDWGACGYVEESKRDNLETVFIALLLSDSSNFMNALKQYDIDLYNKTSSQSKEIYDILNSGDSLESKFGKIFTIFNQMDMSQNHDFLMFIQGLSKIAKYIDNLSAKGKIILLLDDTVIYDLLQNKQVLTNIHGLLGKIVSNKYRKLVNFAVAKLVNSGEENLRNIITDLRLFIVNSEDLVVLERLIRNILKALNLPSAFEKPLKVLISKKIKQLSDMSGSYLQRSKESVKEGKKKHFKVLDFIKGRFFNEAETQQDVIEFSEESEPVVFLIQKDGVPYSLTMELDYVYGDDNDKNYIDVGIKDKKLIAYLSTIGKESFSKETSKYMSIDSIEELLGIRINVSGHTVSVTSENVQTDIEYVRYEDIPKIISNLNGQPIEYFQEKEADLLKDDSGCNGVENLFLDQDRQTIKTKIDSAIKDNKSKVLFALYPFSNDYDISSLSDKQKLALYLQISKSFEDIARTLLSEEYFYRIDDEEINALEYSILELIQKAFFSGNASLSKPIYVSCDYYGGTPTFTVYRKLGDETIDEKQRNLAAVVNKRSKWAKTTQYYQEEKLLTVTPQEKTIRRIGTGKYYTSTIVKTFRQYYERSSRWGYSSPFDDYDDFSMSIDLEDFEDLFEGLEEEALFTEDKEKSSTAENETVERKKNFFSAQKILDIFGENFKFTTVGLILGAAIEVIPFFLPGFISAHNFDPSVKNKMTALVWTMRILTVGIGVATGSLQIAVLSNIVLHSAWNRFVILIGRKDLLLQISNPEQAVNYDQPEEEQGQSKEADITVVQTELPEKYLNLTDDYNQFDHMEGLPDFYNGENYREFERLEEERQNAINAFNEHIGNIASQEYQFVFKGNTKYLYLLQNKNNKHVLLDIILQPNIDLKFRLFALLYLDKLSYDLTSEERADIDKCEKDMIKELKKQIENNEFIVLNNLDLRSYMMGVYLILRDYSYKKNVPDIINRAIIINPFGKTMARDDGLFAKVDLFIVIHELTHRMFYKPKSRYVPVDDALDELVSYIVPNFFLRKIIDLSYEAYSESQELYTIHQSDGVIDYVKMGRKFHSLYSMFDKGADEYEFDQEEHSAPIAFLDYLFKAHQKIGKPINWDVLLEVIDNLSISKMEQLEMFRKMLKLYMKRSVDEGLLTKEEVENMKKEIEEMQVWTILVKEVIEIIESTSSNAFNVLKGNRDAVKYKSEILSETNKMKENFDKILEAFMWNIEFSKSELLVVLIVNIIKNIEYEQLVNNFDGVINGIIDVIGGASEELKLDLNKDKYSQQEYKQMLNFVLANYNVSEHVESRVLNDIFTYISKNLGQFSFATKLINMVFGTRDLTKIFGNKKLLIATSKQQEENFRKLLSNRNDIAVVTMEVINNRVYNIRNGAFLDVQKDIKVTYDSDENKIVVYSKEGINISEDEIKALIKERYLSEREEDSFDDVIAFADVNDSSLQDITDRLNVAYTEAVSIPNKETTFDLSSRKSIKNIVTVCEQESRATKIKTFIITFDQAKDFSDEIQALRERDFKFIVSCKIDAILDIKYYDGLIIDDSKTDYDDISQLLPIMEKVRKHVLKTGVAKPVSVKFSNSTYGKFNSAGINIFDTYGMLPIVEDSYMTNSIIGKFVVEKIRENNIERFLRQNNVVGFVIDNARTFADKKSKLRDLFSNEHKYNRGYNASLSSKIDYTCDDVSLLAEYLNIDINNTEELNRKINKLKEHLEKDSSKLSLSLTHNSRVYLKSLLEKKRYEEAVGFIRGITMNSARTQIVKGLEEKGINLNMNKFANVADGKYQKAFLTIAVQLMMEDIDITELLETDFIDSDMTANEYLDSILEKVNINIEEILKNNEYKIEKIEKEDIPKTIEDFKNYVVLLDNLKIIKETNATFDMSIKAVRSMLSAA